MKDQTDLIVFEIILGFKQNWNKIGRKGKKLLFKGAERGRGFEGEVNILEYLNPTLAYM